MSTLHEELLARIDELGQHLTGCVSCTTCEASALTGLARAVVELHAPRPCNCREAKHVICAGCPGHAVVCATRLAIAEALGIGETPK